MDSWTQTLVGPIIYVQQVVVANLAAFAGAAAVVAHGKFESKLLVWALLDKIFYVMY